MNWSQREEAIYVWREEATKVVRHASRRGSHRRGMRTGIRDGVCGQYVEMLKCVCTSVSVALQSVLLYGRTINIRVLIDNTRVL